eukprot:Sspe_Gene.85484::Locus_56239_Transcript_1_1_Confidence_1.000_Length_1240::g.85484::m.85484
MYSKTRPPPPVVPPRSPSQRSPHPKSPITSAYSPPPKYVGSEKIPPQYVDSPSPTRYRRRSESRRRSPSRRGSGSRGRRRSGSRRRSPSRRSSRSPPRSPRPPHPRGEYSDQRSPQARRLYDDRDRAPEDRYCPNGAVGSDGIPHDVFSPYDPIVRGTFLIDGVNFSKFEASRDRPQARKAFTTALRDDIITCVGQGVRRSDIILRASPGPINGVVLEYDTRSRHPESPALVDADWCMEIEYAIRARDAVAQQRIAQCLFESLCEPGGLDLYESRVAWAEYIDNRPTKMVARRSERARSGSVPTGMHCSPSVHCATPSPKPQHCRPMQTPPPLHSYSHTPSSHYRSVSPTRPHGGSPHVSTRY